MNRNISSKAIHYQTFNRRANKIVETDRRTSFCKSHFSKIILQQRGKAKFVVDLSRASVTASITARLLLRLPNLINKGRYILRQFAIRIYHSGWIFLPKKNRTS